MVGVFRAVRSSAMLMENSVFGVRVVSISTEATIGGILTTMMMIMVSLFVVLRTRSDSFDYLTIYSALLPSFIYDIGGSKNNLTKCFVFC